MACGWHEEPCSIWTLQGLEMITSGELNGTPYGITRVDGWENSGVAAGPVSSEAGDGGVFGDTSFAGRSIVIDGDIRARNHGHLAEAIAELGQVLSRPRIAWLEVDETTHLGVVRRIQVTRPRPVQITQHGDTYALFTLTLEAAEWIREGVDAMSATIGTGTVLQNVGTTDAPLTLRLNGPLTNPGITWPGGAWQYSGTIASGTTITVDLAARSVSNLATTLHSENRASGTWLWLPPGGLAVTRTGTGSGTIVAEWRAAWS